MSISHPELVDQATIVTTALAEFKLHPDDRVLIMTPDSPGFVAAFIGVLQWGAVPLAVSPRLAEADVTAIATATGARLVLASAKRIAELDVEPAVLVDGPSGLWAAALRLR